MLSLCHGSAVHRTDTQALDKLMMMEQMLLTGEPNTEILNKYCELTESLVLQLQMFRANF
jgi:hypothetical protein